MLLSRHTRRREFIGLLSIAATGWPFAVRARDPKKIPRIGFLGLAPEFSGVEALRAGLRDLGYVEDRSVIIEWRWAEKVDQLPELAAELVRKNVDVIVAPSSTFVEAARRATTAIPIVFTVHAARSASDTWQVSRGRAATPQACRCCLRNLPPKNWR
jgi:putative tryptophan/tyrosine transport system substrate-binding protein